MLNWGFRTMVTRAAWTVTVVTAVLTLAAVTACVPQDDGGTPGTGREARESPAHGAVGDVRGAADVLVRHGSSRARTAMEMTSGGTRLTIEGAGVFDYRERVGELTVTLPEAGRGPVTEVIKPGLLYMKNRGAGVPPDKWVRIDTTALRDGNLVTGGVTDPFSAAELLRGAGQVTFVGRLTLDGIDVRHFRGTTDLAAAARRATHAMRAQLTAAARGFSTTAVPFDVYLDGQGRLRKVRHEFVYDNSEGYGVRIASTTSLSAFGTPVRIEQPQPADIHPGKIAAPDG